jgi:bifunctional UDP-N-acetylglucosamine pyrophosphorylase/glucosamine-1-phosphate N-acetyltransferase
MTAPVAIVLAAGQGKRMNSDLPKVLHRACGRPIVEYVLDAARAAGAARLVVVVGHRAELVQQALGRHADVEFARQVRQLGTGDAVKAARSAVGDHQGPVLVLAGDTPLLRSRSLRTLLDEQSARQAACVVGTAETEQNQGLGRIVRDVGGAFQRIVEEKDATPEQKLIREVNTGCYAFHGPDLFAALDEIQPQNQQGEYYLTDCADVLRRRGRPVVAACCFEIAEALGVNTPEQLAQVERVMQSPTPV